MKNEFAENIFGNLITVIIPVETFAVHLICILLHDAGKETHREEEYESGRIIIIGERKKIERR